MELATAIILLWLLVKESAPWWLYLVWALGCVNVCVTFRRN